MFTRTVSLSFLSLLLTLVTALSVSAQSKQRDNPTRLTSNEISGVVDSEVRGNFYYYSFVANPGELTITLTVEPGRKVNDSDFIAFTAVGFNLYDRNAEEIAAKGVSAANDQGTKQTITRVQIDRRQSVTLGVNFPNGLYYKAVGGRYRLRISGPVDLSPSKPTGTTDDLDVSLAINRSSADCLPKRGTLIVKMKDGSKKIIDLSEAETITLVPER